MRECDREVDSIVSEERDSVCERERKSTIKCEFYNRERERGRRRRTGIRSNLFANSAECLCMRVSESESLNGMCMNRERLNRLNRVVLLT